MEILIISASHRINSQSKKVSGFLQKNLSNIDSKVNTFFLDLADAALPFWSPEKKDGKGVWGETWNSISESFIKSDGFIFVVPEYGGMATPAAINIFLYLVLSFLIIVFGLSFLWNTITFLPVNSFCNVLNVLEPMITG